ncbi:MAG: hypothetical protein IBJ15_00105 [Alphaproteobacteria bacterium]|nr:hypothetical protein [Alphaproteobacteria bacterium]
MSPLLTIRRFESAAHGVLPRPLDTAAMVAGGAIVLGMEMMGSPTGNAVDGAVVPGMIVAFAIAARVGREAAQRRRGEKAFGTSAIAMSRFLYLGYALLASTATLLVFTAPTFARVLELLGV